jgi:beta-D-xylosidase 4
LIGVMMSLHLGATLAVAAASDSGGACTLTDGYIVGAGQLSTTSVSSAAACCAECTTFAGCIAFTYDSTKTTSNCFLKDNMYGKNASAGHVSGTHASQTVATRACRPDDPNTATYDFCNTKLPMDKRIDDLVSRLKWEEKAPLLTARESPSGNVSRLNLPEYDWGANCIHGVQSRCGARCPTSFPNPNHQGAAWNRSLWQEMASVTGVELRALWLADLGENHVDNLPHLGLDCWSPNINIVRDPRWGRTLETPGEDPFLNGQYGAWHTRGLQEGEDKRYLQAVVTLKHWDAYSLEDDGDRKKGITRHTFDAKVSKHDLADTYFPAFKNAVREGKAKGVMCSYNAVNGVPSCANNFLLEDVLRGAWNFSGYVTSDSGAVEDIYKQHHYQNMTAAEGVAAAVKAGCDIDSSLDHGSHDSGSPYTWSLTDAKDQGLVTEDDVDALLRRSLKMRFELGLMDPIEGQPYWHYGVEEKVDTPASAALNALATRQVGEGTR